MDLETFMYVFTDIQEKIFLLICMLKGKGWKKGTIKNEKD